MTKSELIKAVAEKSGLTMKDTGKAIDAFTDTITDCMCKDEKVQLPGFGSFETAVRAARMGRNPATGESIMCAETKTVKFKALKGLKDAVNEKDKK